MGQPKLICNTCGKPITFEEDKHARVYGRPRQYCHSWCFRKIADRILKEQGALGPFSKEIFWLELEEEAFREGKWPDKPICALCGESLNKDDPGDGFWMYNDETKEVKYFHFSCMSGEK